MTGPAVAVGSECSTCTSDGRRGYCALGRCYCGHPTCHAYASWYALPAPAETTPEPIPQHAHASSWDTREEDTWIDRL